MIARAKDLPRDGRYAFCVGDGGDKPYRGAYRVVGSAAAHEPHPDFGCGLVGHPHVLAPSDFGLHGKGFLCACQTRVLDKAWTTGAPVFGDAIRAVGPFGEIARIGTPEPALARAGLFARIATEQAS